jgi:predicted DNA-binding protein with PD1-like motif
MSTNKVIIDKGRVVAARITPNKDLKKEIEHICETNNIKCAAILTLLGSLTECKLRRVYNTSVKRIAYDTKSGEQINDVEIYDIIEEKGPFEIVSAEGTISVNGMHVHLILSDSNGNLYAGHLLEGNIVFTTAEIFLIELPNVVSKRIFDSATGHNELTLAKED